MKTRIITGIIMAIIFIPILMIEALLPVFKIGFLVLGGIASFELLSMGFKSNKIDLKMIIGIIVTMLFMVTYAHIFNFESLSLPQITEISWIIIFLIFLILGTLLVFIKDFSGEIFMVIIGCIFYVGIGLGSIVLVRTMGIGFIVYAILIAVLTDVFAYFFGIKFGKTKMAPTISPKKSYEGAIAGTLIATTIGSLFAYYYGTIFEGGFMNPNYLDHLTFLNVSGRDHFLVVLLIVGTTIMLSIVGQLGDLMASKLKRTYGTKDFGTIFPGHGGVLDRFDSLIFIAVFMMLMFVLASNI